MTLCLAIRWVRITSGAVWLLVVVQAASLVVALDLSCGPCALVVGSLSYQVVVAPKLPFEWEARLLALEPSEHTVRQLVPRLETSIFGGLYVLHIPQAACIACVVLLNCGLRRLRTAKHRSGRCPRCDYDLKNQSPCSECGHAALKPET